MFKSLRIFYSLLDATRRLILNIGFILTIVFFGALIWMGTQSGNLEKGTLLQLELTGDLVESLPEADQSFVRQLMGNEFSGQTRLQDVLDALSLAAEDSRISGVVLSVSDLTSAGMAGIRELSQAIDRYRDKSGKKVWVWSPSLTQSQYLIASHADHIAVHPMGTVELKGLSSTSLYFGGLFDFLGIEPEVRKAGAFKSAPEVLTAEEPSRENLMAQKSYMDEAWKGLSNDIEERRMMPKGSVNNFLEGFETLLNGRDSITQTLCEKGYIDAVSSWEEFESELGKAYASNGQAKDLLVIHYLDYLNFHPRTQLTSPGVAVIVAEGEISQYGESGITPDRMATLLSDVGSDSNVKALVIRVNSPGGDALASEMIRTNIEQFKSEHHIPVVVSMGDAAASGGYWISTVADKIVADPYSITGSIGVFAMTFHAETLRNRLDIGRGGYRTSPLSDLGRPFSGPSELENRWIDHEVDRTYQTFKSLVSTSRGMSPDAVEAVAQGRVWMGTQALKNGLVDRLGGYDEAIAFAIELAELPQNASVIRIELVPEGMRAMMLSLLQISGGSDLKAWLKAKEEWNTLMQISGKPLVRLPSEPTL